MRLHQQQAAVSYLAAYYANMSSTVETASPNLLKGGDEDMIANESATESDAEERPAKRPKKKASKVSKGLPVLAAHRGELWGFGGYDDKEQGLQARLMILDAQPDVTYADRENGDMIGNILYIMVVYYT